MLASERLLWIVSIGLEAVLLVRLHQSRLLRVFRWFAFYIAANLICDLVLIWIPYRTAAYSYVWTVTEIVLCAGRCMVGFELWQRICAPLGEVRTVKALAFLAAIAPAAGLSLAITHSEFARLGCSALQYGVALSDRFSWLCIAGFAASSWVIFQPFRPHWSANTVAHWRLLSMYALLMAATWVSVILFGTGAVQRANLVMMAGNIVLFLGWSALLTEAGESAPRGQVTAAEIRHSNGENAA